MAVLTQDRIICGDCREVLAGLDAGGVHCCISPPPYWGLRKYAGEQTVTWADGEYALGLEPTPEMYVSHIVECMAAVRRVLRDDGTLWLNLGDSYNTNSGGNWGLQHRDGRTYTSRAVKPYDGMKCDTLKAKDLCMMPFRVYSALQADGWYLRSIIIWAKPNPMPESVTDRPTTAHEYVGLFSKSPRYYYDADAIREAANYDGRHDTKMKGGEKYNAPVVPGQSAHTFALRGHERWPTQTEDGSPGRNKRTVWTIPTAPYADAHFATFPPKLVEPMIKAATSERGVCGKCGAPWTRMVDAGEITSSGGAYIRHEGNVNKLTGESATMVAREHKTVGWQPPCCCGAEHPIPQAELDADPTLLDDFEIEPHDTAPAVVLDPFAGSGTVGLVAKQLGRNYILIDAAQEYCDMAQKRIGSWLC